MGTRQKILMQAMMLVVMVMMSVVFSKEVGAESENKSDWIDSVHVTPSEVSFGNEMKVKVTVKVNNPNGIGSDISIKYILPYLDEEEEEVYEYVNLKYNSETDLYEGVLNTYFDFEQVGTWEIDMIHSGVLGLIAYNSNVHEPRDSSERESMEELSSGNITLLEPAVGWNYFKEYGETQGHWYYFDEKKLEFVTGWFKENGKQYYLNDNGMMVTGWVLVDGKWYYLKENGSMVTGWTLVNGEWYYLSADGAMKTGWTLVDGKWYYLKESGSMMKGWALVNGQWYYLNAEGSMATDWILVNNTWYYLNASGSMVTGWLQKDRNWYYLHSNGAMAVGKHFIDGKWYGFKENGAMMSDWNNGKTGWRIENGKLYYLNHKGVKVTGWLQDSGKWYYFNTKGEAVIGSIFNNGKGYYLQNDASMAIGWISLEGEKYYFDENGVRAAGWKEIDGKWYSFFPPTGKMSKNTWVNSKYWVDANGVWTKTR